MALGTNKARNHGKDAQLAALSLALHRHRVAYQVLPRSSAGSTCKTLWLTPSADGVTLPFIESAAELVNVARGRWEAHHPVNGELLAKGVSERDVIRATIERVCH